MKKSHLLEKKCSRCGQTSFRETKRGFSLDFPAFEPSVLDRTRRKVDLRCKGYAWASIFVEFRQLQEVGIFSCLVYSLAKSHFMDEDL